VPEAVQGSFAVQQTRPVVEQGVARSAQRLARAGCVAADAEARELHDAAPDAPTLERWIRRREHGEPLAWITGTTTFANRRLHVAPGVYVPRPQTEALADRAARVLPAAGWALDLCTGTGAVAAHLRATVPSARVLAADLDVRAAACARRNGVPTIVADLAGAVGGDGRWHVVTAVAPYVPTAELRLLPADVQRYEPRRALDGGADGLDVVRRVLAAATRLLRPGGWVLVAVGGAQAERLPGWLEEGAFDRLDRWTDELGDGRGFAARRA
jgi:release factor glutamine methyltransferase